MFQLFIPVFSPKARFCCRQTLNWITIPRNRTRQVNTMKFQQQKFIPNFILFYSFMDNILKRLLSIGFDPSEFRNLFGDYIRSIIILGMANRDVLIHVVRILCRCRVSLRGQYKLGGKARAQIPGTTIASYPSALSLLMCLHILFLLSSFL